METKHLSQNALQKIYTSEVKKIGLEGLEGLKSEKRSRIQGPQSSSIFLCHSHLDKTIVNKMLLLFNKLNVDLYIDWMDDSMPELTDRTTASIIKEKIDSSSKFIFLATYNALRSKWCNWELGLAYSSKGEKDFAILPIESKNGNWSGNEYLQLYPEMQMNIIDEQDVDTGNIKINFYNQNTIDFENWINS
ncbi:TIR domain-containing protein [Pedobacter sp. UC225_65]|uniref:TIR domain-containing protein n=1 Tax=Pedobacter sp. UC225_65 TaxID=3350173 RepID=UPI003671F023